MTQEIQQTTLWVGLLCAVSHVQVPAAAAAAAAASAALLFHVMPAARHRKLADFGTELCLAASLATVCA
jgi:hypothetical protein